MQQKAQYRTIILIHLDEEVEAHLFYIDNISNEHNHNSITKTNLLTQNIDNSVSMYFRISLLCIKILSLFPFKE